MTTVHTTLLQYDQSKRFHKTSAKLCRYLKPFSMRKVEKTIQRPEKGFVLFLLEEHVSVTSFVSRDIIILTKSHKISFHPHFFTLRFICTFEAESTFGDGDKK
ncbi:hypothetical protein QVD17_06654 [Tagetes erecta]|uniref:Uncharacterized protein n=1 Tax=Tagetes erecta TaxID=13708 RepID=A0AAD8PCD3_TARER|nr:hypothetical protein QVD17_06654 [Tagetes erecta]